MKDRIDVSILFFENGMLPSSRSIKELRTLVEAGFDVSVLLSDDVEVPPEYKYEIIRAPLTWEHPIFRNFRQGFENANDRFQQLKSERDSTFKKYQDADSGDEKAELLVNFNDLKQQALDAAMELRVERACAWTIPAPFVQKETFGDILSMVERWRSAAKAIALAEPDIIWAADLDALPAVVWAAEANKESAPKVVYDAHELFTDLDYLPSKQHEAWFELARDFIPCSDLVLTVCDAIAAELKRDYGATRVEVILNLPTSDNSEGGDLRTSLDMSEEIPLVVHVGNIVANRRPEILIEAVAASEDLHAAFLGDIENNFKEILLTKAKNQRVVKRIHFVDPVPMNRLVNFIGSADLGAILYSGLNGRNLKFAMPNKLFDCLAAGLPCIASDSTDAGRWLVDNGLGSAFQEGEIDTLLHSIENSIADKDLQKAVAKKKKGFLWESKQAELVKLIDSLAGL